MKKLMKKKNNKGFSLVELIVVVLIMGIIAVALAPQVMKWVGTARENSDKNTAKDIKSAIQIAVADCQSQGKSVGTYTNVEYSLDGMDDLNADFKACVEEVTGKDFSAKKSDGSCFKFSVDANGVVTVN